MTEFIPVPCGYGPPGELPSPLPSGVDGGIIVIPGGGEPVDPDPGIIIIPVEPPPPQFPGNPSGVPQPPIIEVPSILVTDVNVNIQFNTNITANVSCGLYLGPQLVQAYANLNSYQLNHNIIFNNLLPLTAYNFKIICTEPSVFHLKTTAFGSFSTLQTQIPGFNDPPTQLEVETEIVLLPSNPSQIPIEEQDPPFGSEPGSGPVIITQFVDPPINPGVINDPYSIFILNSSQNSGEFDLKYTPYKINQTRFLPVYAEEQNNIFDKVRHKSIQNILKNQTTTFEVANIDNQNISYAHIKTSLRNDLKNIIDKVKYPNGLPVQEQVLLDSIFKHIQNKTLDKIDPDYLITLSGGVSTSTTPSTRANILATKYGTTKAKIDASRRIQPTTIVRSNNSIVKNPKTASEILKNKLVSIDGNKYTDDSQNLLKLWYCLPTDINQRISLLNNDGSLSSIYLNNQDAITLLDSDSETVQLYANNNNSFFEVLTNTSSYDYLYTESDINRAYTVRNIDEHLIMYHLGVEKDILFQVSCLNPLAELDYDIENTVDSHFILKLDTSSIVESDNLASPLIVETEANYHLMDKSTSDSGTINDDLKYRAYPWLVLNIDSNDPILDYLISPSCTGSTIKLTFKDLTYKYITDSSDVTVPLLPRKIPRFILILPTDRTKFNIYNGHSFVKDWNIRCMRFLQSPDQKLINLGLMDHPFIVENTFVNSSGESNSGYFETNAYHCRYTSSLPTFNVSLKSTSSLSNRLDDGFRKAVKVVSSLYENFNTSSGITWYDVLSRLDRREFYTLTRFSSKEVLNKLRSGETIPVKIYHVRGPQGTSISQRRSGTRLAGLKADGVDEYRQKYAEVDVFHVANSAAFDKISPPDILTPPIQVNF